MEKRPERRPDDCLPCWERGFGRTVEIEFRGKEYCSTCKSYWVDHQELADREYLSLPKRLKRAIKLKGMRYKEIGPKVEVSAISVGRYTHREDPAYPSLQTFSRLCFLLRIPPNELLGYVDPRTRKLEEDYEKLKRDNFDLKLALYKLGYNWDPNVRGIYPLDRSRPVKIVNPQGLYNDEATPYGLE